MLTKKNISEMVEKKMWEKLQFYRNQTCNNIKKCSEIKAANSLDTTDLWDKTKTKNPKTKQKKTNIDILWEYKIIGRKKL